MWSAGRLSRLSCEALWGKSLERHGQSRGGQEVHSFDDHWPDADQGVLNSLEGPRNLLMVLVAPAEEEGDQRACINQNGTHSVGS